MNKSIEAYNEVKPNFPPKIQTIWNDCGTYITSSEHEQAAKEIEFFVKTLIEKGWLWE